MAVMRELDDKEDAVKEFVCRGCGCDLGLKTPCSMLFPIEHYLSLRASFSEMSQDLFVIGQIMAHCYQSAHSAHLRPGSK